MDEPAAGPTPEPGAKAPPQPDLPGPYPVGRYARELREFLRGRARVALIGEVVNLRLIARSGNAFFELRDPDGAVPCRMWASDLERMRLPADALRDGAQVIVSGGLDYYTGSATSSPGMSFQVAHLRLAGEGDLLARLAELRRRLHAEGLFRHQKRLARPALPRTIGVVTAEGGAARRDLVAGLERRGWRGTIVWAFAPVQDRGAAPAIARAVTDLAALSEVAVIVVCRGGGSLADLWAFCDEALCRTVALLGTPLISAVGHETDSTLIDDVAAVACSTPTHAAEAAVPLDCVRARGDLGRAALALDRQSRGSLVGHGRRLVAMARVPADRMDRQRQHLHQKLRETRAAAARGLLTRSELQQRVAGVVLSRKRAAGRARALREGRSLARRAAELERASLNLLGREQVAAGQRAVSLRAHDPRRTLERGYAVVRDREGEVVARAGAARRAGAVEIGFADGAVRAEVARGDGEGGADG